MTVQCPNCSTKYRFDESRLKKDLKVRCTRCEHVFSPSFLNDEEDTFQKPAPPREPPSPDPWESYPGEESPDDMRVEITPQQKTSWPDSAKLKKIGALVGLLILIAGSLVLALPRIAEYVYIPFVSSEPDTTEQVTQKKEFTEEDVREIILDNVQQYFVSNDNIGQLFVVEGRAVNEFETPRSRIKLRAVLYDAQEQVVQEREFLAGNAASLFQLQVSSREELESTLTSQLGILTNNKYIEPGGSTPFMTVFYNPPEKVHEFGLEVIEAHIPE
ncbi:DUF3426 domain-containing protein [Desulfonatronospira sp.]|uniref:DUF3426 domain-containing protein n=1 Tax=Desulfonatronospira sp. TaxID=1962951 RepID=UPI0025C61B86|nr:DUF3426 domain-containing protein [Desulfonatronospira sp.]